MDIIPQIIGLLAVVTFLFSYQQKKRKNIITGQAILSFTKATISILLIYALNVFERYICQNVFSEYPAAFL